MVLEALRSTLPFFSGPSNPTVDEIRELMDMWRERNKKFEDWYRLLRLEDVLETAHMESFVGNDPRTTWNMAVYLLQPRPFTHQIVTDDGSILPVGMKPIVDLIQRYFNRVWQQIDAQDIGKGKGGWFRTLVGYLVATGWIAMPYTIKQSGSSWVDYWNPCTVYPDFNEDGEMYRLARVRTVSLKRAQRLIKQNGWSTPRAGLGKQIIYARLWKKEDDGRVTLRTVLGNTVVAEEVLEGFVSIPVLVARTGGIPGKDDELEGQSILATNEPLFMSLNRQMTFMSQLIRDSANPVSWEKSASGRQIINDPDQIYKRGAHFRMGIQDDLGFMEKPPIPVELSQVLFRINSMLGKGGFSDLTFGNILQEISAVLVSQAAEAAMQLMEPYHTLIELGVSEITNSWYWGLLNNPGLRPRNWPEIDVEQLEGTRIESSYAVKIPGDLANRVNMAKTLNPNFRLDSETVLALMLPEVASPVEALARLDGERAKERPEYQLVQLVHGFEQLARESAAAGNRDNASLYMIVASNMRQQLTQVPQAQDKSGVTSQALSLSQLRSGVNGNR